MTEHPPLGVLFMAYGGPDSLEDIPGYLAYVREGRTTPRRVLQAIRRNYEQIGGASPLLARSRQQVQAVAARLDPQRYRCYLGMRHWAPWIEDVIRQMLADGIRRGIAIPLAPHYSALSVARYHEAVRQALREHRGHIDFHFVDSYHDAPGLIAALAARVQQGMARWPAAERQHVHVVFSAHSLPVRVLANGDPYDEQVKATARLVAAEAGLGPEQWSFCYQSAGRSAEPWLGPSLAEHLQALAAQGVRNVLSIPVGFVSEHVEILVDIDIEAQQQARQLGMRLERPPALNDDPLFIDSLVQIIQQATPQTA